MTKQMICPICQAVNEVDESAVGCYVLCRNCPHQFYVPVPPLGERFSDQTPAAPNVVPDYKSWERQFKGRTDGIEARAAELRWQRTMLFVLLAAQGVTGLLVLLLMYLVGRCRIAYS